MQVKVLLEKKTIQFFQLHCIPSEQSPSSQAVWLKENMKETKVELMELRAKATKNNLSKRHQRVCQHCFLLIYQLMIKKQINSPAAKKDESTLLRLTNKTVNCCVSIY